MADASPLLAVAVVEQDTNNDVMLVWSYPSLVPVELEKVLPAQAEPFLRSEAKRSVYFTRFGTSWLHGCVTFDSFIYGLHTSL